MTQPTKVTVTRIGSTPDSQYLITRIQGSADITIPSRDPKTKLAGDLVTHAELRLLCLDRHYEVTVKAELPPKT